METQDRLKNDQKKIKRIAIAVISSNTDNMAAKNPTTVEHDSVGLATAWIFPINPAYISIRLKAKYVLPEPMGLNLGFCWCCSRNGVANLTACHT
jgi:hypothetical protein